MCTAKNKKGLKQKEALNHFERTHLVTAAQSLPTLSKKNQLVSPAAQSLPTLCQRYNTIPTKKPPRFRSGFFY